MKPGWVIFLFFAAITFELHAGPKLANGWDPFAPRDEIAPECTWDAKGGRSGKGALKISTQDATKFGGWKRTFNDIEGGKTYRFTAWYRPEHIKYERKSIVARLEWLDDRGKSLRAPDYAIDVAKE